MEDGPIEAKVEQVRPLASGTLKLQSDERLLKLFRRGVEAAFEELIGRYRPALVAYAGSIAGPDRAEDVVQDSLVKAHRSLQDDRDIDPRPWLYAVVRNTALNDVRDNRKHRHDGLGEVAGPGATPDDVVEQRERFAAVLAAVADLPPAQRRALVDHELSGFSHEEIAAELELSTGATKQLIYRARISLRNAFGAMIPLPLVAWLSENPGLVATGAAGTSATGTGLMSAIGGGGAAKLAVVAVVAGGSLAGGIAVEHNQSGSKLGGESLARATEPPRAAEDNSVGTESASGADDSGRSQGSGEQSMADDKSGRESGSKDDRSGEGSGDNPSRTGGRESGKDGSGSSGGSLVEDGRPGGRPSGGRKPQDGNSEDESSGEGSEGGTGGGSRPGGGGSDSGTRPTSGNSPGGGPGPSGGSEDFEDSIDSEKSDEPERSTAGGSGSSGSSGSGISGKSGSGDDIELRMSLD